MEPFFKNDLEHWRSDYRNFKCYLSVHKSDLGHWRSDLNHFKTISAATKVTLATEENLVITATSKLSSAFTKVILATEEVVTATLKII